MKANDQQDSAKLEKLLRQWGAAEAAARGASGGGTDAPPEVLAALPASKARTIAWHRWVSVAAAASLAILAGGYLLGVALPPRWTHESQRMSAPDAAMMADSSPAPKMMEVLPSAVIQETSEIDQLHAEYQQQLQQQALDHQAAMAELEERFAAAAGEAERLAGEAARLKGELAAAEARRHGENEALRRQLAAAEQRTSELLRLAESRQADLEHQLTSAKSLAADMRQRWIESQPVRRNLVTAESAEALVREAEGLIKQAADVRAATSEAETRQLVERVEALLTQVALRSGVTGGSSSLARNASRLDLPARIEAMVADESEPETVIRWLTEARDVLTRASNGS